MVRWIELDGGNHSAPFDGEQNATMCAMEYAAYLAGEPHSDRPRCVSPILRSLMMRVNDILSDTERQRLKPFIVRSLGTAGDGQDEARRDILWCSSITAVEVCSCDDCREYISEERNNKIDKLFNTLDRMVDPGGIHDIQEQLGMVVNEPLEEVAV